MRLDNTLILMACSQTKKAMPTGWDAVPLIDLYDGPMWRSLRTHLGCAYQPAQAFEARDAWGVMGMRERARHFGGQIHIRSAPGQGTTTQLRLALPAGAPA